MSRLVSFHMEKVHFIHHFYQIGSYPEKTTKTQHEEIDFKKTSFLDTDIK